MATVMKMKSSFLGIVFCAATSLSAVDLTVGQGETLDVTESAVYETVTVHGTLNIESGAKLTATVLELGPDVGDAAIVNVLGSNATGLDVDTVNVGRNGGTGQIVALSSGAVHNTGFDKVVTVAMVTVNICRDAAVSSDGFIDFLKLGPGTADFRSMFNESDSSARILVKDGCLGYTQYWGLTMFASGAFRIESFDGGNIRIGSGYSNRKINASSCSLVIDGNGHDVVFCRYVDAEKQSYELYEGVEWVDVRNFCMTERHPVVLKADDLLPYGPGVGGVLLDASDLCVLHIGNTVQRLNSFSSPLSLEKETLKGSDASKVIFGEGDQDGHLAGRIGDGVGVFKVGAGTFSITNAAQVGSFTASNGTVRIAAEFRLEKLTVESGATLVVDGVTVEPTSGSAAVNGELVLLNGGRLKSSRTVESDERIAGFSASGEWTKNGTGIMLVEDPASMPSNVIVKAGTLAFTAAGYPCDLYKWNVTNWNNRGYFDRNNGAEFYRFYLGELAFVDPSGNRIGAGVISGKPAGTDPGELQPGEATFAEGTKILDGSYGGVSSLFDNNQWPRVAVETPYTTNENGVTLYVRLPEGSGPVSAINFMPAYGGCPRSWILSGSVDGGQTWKVLNEEEFVIASDSDVKHMEWFGTAENGVPLKFRFNCADTSWAVPGVGNMPPVMQLEVSPEAVADFTNVTGGQTVDTLTIDAAAGGGTVKNVSFAESGTIHLKNLPSDASLHDFSVRLTLLDAKDIANLAGWRICADGVELNAGKYKACYSEGFLRITGTGMTIIVR